MKVKFSNKEPWKKKKNINNNLFLSSKTIKNNFDFFFLNINPKLNVLITNLKKIDGYFSLICENRNYIFAAVDHVRSFPIFYDQNTVSNSSEFFNDFLSDKNSVKEIYALGYVTEKKTLKRNVSQLLCGEYLFYDKKKKKLTIDTYFQYLPRKKKKISSNNLDKVINVIIDKLIEYAEGRKICIPLSGGLDSRLILCKLVEKKYDNIFTFTYGNSNNEEMLIAKKITKKLNIPWSFFESKNHQMKKSFMSSERKRYWEFSYNLSAIPSMTEYLAIKKLKSKFNNKKLLLVNGQTGDFITGGHIPPLLKSNGQFDELFKYIWGKHFNLWKDFFKIAEKKLIKENLKKKFTNKYNLSENYEKWEYEERQSKFVINGQRVYEFFNLDWWMPLWDIDFVKFWRDVEPLQKFSQKAYIEYLKEWNYSGLFDNTKRALSTWPEYKLIIIILLKLTKIFGGKKTNDYFISLFQLFSTYGYQYAAFNFLTFFKFHRKIRNPVSLFSYQFLKENKLLELIYKD